MRRFAVFCTVAATLAAGTILVGTPAQAASATSTDAGPAPTVVLVHGAWWQASSWTAVAARLRDRGYPVVVPDNPLRTLAGDAASIAGVLQRIAGPIVLVGHSYGGNVITDAAEGNPNVKALVYIAGFAPDRGESAFTLDALVPGSLLPVSLVPVASMQPSGELALDLYVNPVLFRTVLAQDVPGPAAAALAAAQRPVTLAALLGQSTTPAWKTIPSWYMVAASDRAIPPATQRFMAERAGANTVEIDSSHAAPVAHPDAVTDLILAAAGTVSTAGSASPPAVVPAVAGLRLSPSTFRAARTGPPVRGASVPTATRVSYTLNVPARVRLSVQRSGRGREAGGRCLASNRRGPPCTRFVSVRGSVTRDRPAGADGFTFTGRIAGRALRQGRYRLVATPSANGRTGRPARAQFRIVR